VNIRLTHYGEVQAVTGVDTAEYATTDIFDQTWTHIALRLTPECDTDKSVNCTVYVDYDGECEGNNKQSFPFHSLTAEQGGLQGACIGALNNGSQGWAKILIDDFRIYDVDLSDSDIALLADSDINTNPDADPNLIIMYNFDDGSGTVAAQSGSISEVYHPVSYALPNPPGSKANIYTKESQPRQVGQKINPKDYARLAKYWMYTIPNWP
jgi:hypothetical protein